MKQDVSYRKQIARQHSFESNGTSIRNGGILILGCHVKPGLGLPVTNSYHSRSFVVLQNL